MLALVLLIYLRMLREGEYSPHFLYFIAPIILIVDGVLVILKQKIAIYILCFISIIGVYLSLRYAIELGPNPATPIYLLFGALCGGVVVGVFHFRK